MKLDLIDLEAPMSAQAEAMSHACESTGFFRIPLGVIDRSVADAAWDAGAEFFAVPEDEKRKVEFPEAGYPYGYSPFRFETLARSLGDGTAAQPDLKESFSVGPDCGGESVSPPEQAWIRSPSLWPEQPIGIQKSWTDYYRALAAVSEHLMSVMALALGMPTDHFDSLIDAPITSMRAINYPEVTGSGGSALRAGAHSDYGTLTILRTGDVAGLEIRDTQGRWQAVPHDPETFVVNLGDSIAQWTNDRWRSTVHRVTTADGRQRQSFAFFHMANWDATIECLPTCVPEGDAPVHTPVEAGPWLMQKFQSTVT